MGCRTAQVSQTRVSGTDLTVVTDVADAARAVDVEKRVIEGYAADAAWPHREVTLFVLDGLEPLVRQLRAAERVPVEDARELPDKPMVNLYDAANPGPCYVFVNRPVLVREGLWEDALALEGMLAHEHAHPLSENPTTRAARNRAEEALATALGREIARLFYKHDAT